MFNEKKENPSDDPWSDAMENIDTDALGETDANIASLRDSVAEVVDGNSNATLVDAASTPETLRDLSEVSSVAESYLKLHDRAEKSISAMLLSYPPVDNPQDNRYANLLRLGGHSPSFYNIGLIHIKDKKLRRDLVDRLIKSTKDDDINGHDSLVALVESLNFIPEIDLTNLVLAAIRDSGSGDAYRSAMKIIMSGK